MSLLTNPLNQCVIPASELLLQIDLCLFEHFAQWFFNRCLLHSSTSLTCSKQLTQVSPSSPPVRSPSPTQSKKKQIVNIKTSVINNSCLFVCAYVAVSQLWHQITSALLSSNTSTTTTSNIIAAAKKVVYPLPITQMSLSSVSLGNRRRRRGRHLGGRCTGISRRWSCNQ